MTWRIVIRPQALDDLVETRRWYDGRRQGLGEEVGHAADDLILRIAEAPLAFPRAEAETRRAVLYRFPYSIYFWIEGDAVVILTIHGRQDPTRWQQRA